MKYSDPKPFKDGNVLDLMTPRGFMEAIKEMGFIDITEAEFGSLMRVLAKPELDGQVILNEFILIMENFGIPVMGEEDEYENDYMPDSDSEADVKRKEEVKKRESAPEKKKVDKEHNKDLLEITLFDEKKRAEETAKAEKAGAAGNEVVANDIADIKKRAAEPARNKKNKNPLALDFDVLDAKAVKMMKKLSRFLLERYMHPREFFGPTIKKEELGKKRNKVEVIKHHDFYLRLKLASIRKKLKENASLNAFNAIDGDKYPGYMQVKRLIKALEIIAEGEQELMAKEHMEEEKKKKEEMEKTNKERAEQGLPPLEEEEKKKEEEKEKKKPEDLNIDKPAGAGGLGEMLKLGGKGSPKDKDSGRASSHFGPMGQLNTIEEDLHETQTSHYSQALRGEGDITDRNGSKHQLSVSQQMRGSQLQQDLEDSAR